jgi:hypothetical protein
MRRMMTRVHRGRNHRGVAESGGSRDRERPPRSDPSAGHPISLCRSGVGGSAAGAARLLGSDTQVDAAPTRREDRDELREAEARHTSPGFPILAEQTWAASYHVGRTGVGLLCAPWSATPRSLHMSSGDPVLPWWGCAYASELPRLEDGTTQVLLARHLWTRGGKDRGQDCVGPDLTVSPS